MKERKFEQALHVVESVIRQDPKNAVALVLRVNCRMMLTLPLEDRFLDDELAAIQRCLEADPTHSVLRGFRGVLLLCDGDPKRAEAELTYAIENGAGAFILYYHRGLARMRMEEYAPAISDFSLAATKCPPSPVPTQVLTARAMCFMSLRDFDGAIADLTVVIRRHPAEYVAYEIRSDAYFEKKDLDRALADYEQVVTLRPDDGMAWVRCATFRFRKGDRAGALSDVDRAVKLDPQGSGVYFLRGVFRFLDDGIGEQVLADADRAIALAPGNPYLYAFRGFLRAKDLRCVPAFNDFATCFLLRKRAEFSLFGYIDHARGRFNLGARWKVRESEDQRRPRVATVLASASDRDCIDLAMQHLVAATWGGGR